MSSALLLHAYPDLVSQVKAMEADGYAYPGPLCPAHDYAEVPARFSTVFSLMRRSWPLPRPVNGGCWVTISPVITINLCFRGH